MNRPRTPARRVLSPEDAVIDRRAAGRWGTHGRPSVGLVRGLPAACCLVLLAAWGAAAAQTADLGSIDFPTSGPPAAQAHFERGVLLLHSFEYRDARDAFQSAQELAPDYAMAYWGEAMTYNHPIWLEEDLDSARAVLARLAPTPEERAAKAPTQREKRYLATVEILFGDGDKVHRDHAYAEALRAMMEDDPSDLEAASFYSLALLGTCHEGRDAAIYMRAAAIADRVFDQNPRHPGAAHYLIHATDDPVHAPLGLEAARSYAQIAPAAGHALHMPSHIFLALGLWDEVSSSNEDSWDAVAARVEREGWAIERHNYHALLWWHYALLQQGKIEQATQLLERMADDDRSARTRRTGNHLALMRAAHAVDAGTARPLTPSPHAQSLDLEAAASVDFTAGLAAVNRGDIGIAMAAIAGIKGRVMSAKGSVPSSRDGYTQVGGVRTSSAEIMALTLEAMLAAGRGDYDAAVQKATEAVAIEAETPFGFGPPVPAKPASELLGEILLEAGRTEEALAQLESALRRTPRRARSLVAKLEAARQLARAEVVERALGELKAISEHADTAVRAARLGTAPSAVSGEP